MQVLKTEPCDVCNSEICPCILATLQECMICSHLQANKESCDCDWQKVCVYLNYLHNGTIIPKVLTMTGTVLLRCLKLREDIFLLYLAVSPELFDKLSSLDKVYFCSSISAKSYRVSAVILQKYPAHHVVSLGIKTSLLDERLLTSKHLSYYLETTGRTTVLGLAPLAKTSNGKILIIAEGLGELMVPALVQNFLAGKGNEIDVVIAEPQTVFKRKVLDLGAQLNCIGTDFTAIFSSAAARGINYCCSLGNVELHKRVAQAMFKSNLSTPLAATLFD